MIGGDIAQAPYGQRDARRDLVTSGQVADGRVEHPEELIGMAIRMAAGAGKGAGGGGRGGLEGFAPALQGGVGRIGEGDSLDQFRASWLADVEH